MHMPILNQPRVTTANVEESLVIANGTLGQIGDVVPLLAMEVFISVPEGVLLRNMEGSLVRVVLKTLTRAPTCLV